ncbi:MAG TPA: peptidylprolyl isomerase [Porticoccaceae bacterium]|nr:peptidylprolyl isomerase [Porticoccaceae bacterium]
MVIAPRSVVAIHYTLTDEQGVTLDASAPDQPLVYLHGAGNIIPGLERALLGRSAGDNLAVTVAPADAYGEWDGDMVQQVPRDLFGEDQEIAIGMCFSGNTPQGPITVVVTAIAGDQVTLDGNHPMAGKTLHFDVTVDAVRAATDQELLHGHIHGPGCHH